MNFGSALRRRSRRPLRVVLPAVVVAAGLALTACGSGGKSSGGGNTLFVTSTAGIDTVPKADRRPVNDISGKTLDGKNLTVASLKGKVVVLNVWGSWCPPCREEAPYFAKVAKDTRAKGVAFVGINTRDANKDLAVAFEKNYGIDYPSLYDPAGNVILNGFPKGSLNPQAIPSTIVLDRSGKIAARSLMAIDEAKLRKMITPLIAEK
ncbi:redoxin domain-containing protein [Streptomyces sp. 150FB]|jgi:thiol-disulfide isomerase/thioredoxin|uniref:TlpA family protein disulfide reductase n=1 Tax=Streptomyces sp. 150FB TaxID=1576605 RepID=UPI0005894FB7|nr:TlpA disulfide reductase family protein [Streptomyces sp. 150FB]KIF76112.1 redoxin domain-containing protein [Streptomyces sp. 150FB]